MQAQRHAIKIMFQQQEVVVHRNPQQYEQGGGSQKTIVSGVAGVMVQSGSRLKKKTAVKTYFT